MNTTNLPNEKTDLKERGHARCTSYKNRFVDVRPFQSCITESSVALLLGSWVVLRQWILLLKDRIWHARTVP